MLGPIVLSRSCYLKLMLILYQVSQSLKELLHRPSFTRMSSESTLFHCITTSISGILRQKSNVDVIPSSQKITRASRIFLLLKVLFFKASILGILRGESNVDFLLSSQIFTQASQSLFWKYFVLLFFTEYLWYLERRNWGRLNHSP